MKFKDTFVEVDFWQSIKAGQKVPGDVFESKRYSKQGRIICTLADGLGSGIKANVLATLASTMSVQFISSEIDIKRSAEIIMQTLPLCKERGIGYSTFTIADIRSDGEVRLIEYENPAFILLRGGKPWKVKKTPVSVDAVKAGGSILYYSKFQAQLDDCLMFCSDGVTQSGRGKEGMPFGWGEPALNDFVVETYAEDPAISARDLARRVVKRAVRNDTMKPQDDISCAVINFRKPRKLLVVTGPPSDEKYDHYAAELMKNYEGSKVIAGGTTANIVSRELGRKIKVDLADYTRTLPPVSRMQGIDLITEGTLTLTRAAELLEEGYDPDNIEKDAATMLIEKMLENDIIDFLVGTKINQAHMGPDFPIEMDIRRNLVKRLMKVLREKYLKEVNMQLV